MSETPEFHAEVGGDVRNLIQAGTVVIGQESPPDPPWDLGLPTRHWTDRTEPLDFLASHLNADAPHPLLISGPSGVGKTSLVAVAASLVKRHYPGGVLHIELGDRGADDAMRSALERIGQRGLPDNSADLEKRYIATFASKRMIVVLDGDPRKDDVRRFWPRSTSVAYIVLAPKPIRWREAVSLELPPLDAEDAATLLRRADPLGSDVVERLIRAFGGYPGPLLDAGCILAADVLDVEELVALAGDGQRRRLLLAALESVDDEALRVYQALNLLPRPVVEQSLLDALDAVSGERPSEALKSKRLLVEAGAGRWRLMSNLIGAEAGSQHV